LLQHNVFLADHQYRASFDRIFKHLTLPDEPSFYVNAPSRTEPGFAPADGDGLMALVPVGHLNEDSPQDWTALEQRARATVLGRLKQLGVGDVSSRLVFEETWGPPFYKEQLNLEKVLPLDSATILCGWGILGITATPALNLFFQRQHPPGTGYQSCCFPPG
jgi:phytoene dehydrogenase-like protein